MCHQLSKRSKKTVENWTEIGIGGSCWFSLSLFSYSRNVKPNQARYNFVNILHELVTSQVNFGYILITAELLRELVLTYGFKGKLMLEQTKNICRTDSLKKAKRTVGKFGT
jgi:hypothetical protein